MVKILILTCMLYSICAITANDNQTLQGSPSTVSKPRSRANSIQSLKEQEYAFRQQIVHGTGEKEFIEKFQPKTRSKSFTQLPEILDEAK